MFCHFLAKFKNSKWLPFLKNFSKSEHSISNSENVLVKLCCKLIKSGSMSNVSRILRTISNDLSCAREVCCECPCKFARLLRNKHDTYVNTDDLVSSGNIRDLLFLRDMRSSRFSTKELNCLLENVCTL